MEDSELLELLESRGYVLSTHLEIALLRVVNSRRLLIFQGESGTGKTSLARLLCAARRARIVVQVDPLAPAAIGLRDIDDLIRQSSPRDSVAVILDGLDEIPVEVQTAALDLAHSRPLQQNGRGCQVFATVRTAFPVAATVVRELVAESAVLSFPPLRSVPGEIPRMARALLAGIALDLGRGAVGIDARAIEILTAYYWPGNIRELVSVLEGAAARNPASSITPDDLKSLSDRRASVIQGAPRTPTTRAITVDLHHVELAVTGMPCLDLRAIGAAVERAAISEALRRTSGNRTRAAAMVGLSLRAFHYKLKEYGLDNKRGSSELPEPGFVSDEPGKARGTS